MAVNRSAGNSTKPTVVTKTPSDGNGYYTKRDKAQKVDFSKIQEILQRNVTKNINRTFAQYTKDLIKQYVQNPAANQDTIREISRFLCRNSMLYQKLIMYYASMPLFYYNMTYTGDMTGSVDDILKKYESATKRFSHFDLEKEGYTALYFGIRDGIYIGFMYDSEEDGMFLMPLDPRYCRIYGKNAAGQWIVYFDATFFDTGNNRGYVEAEVGRWDEVFVQGFRAFKERGRDYQWFELPPEYTCVMTIGPDDEFMYPLPFFLPLFTSLLDLLDLEQILQSRTELENYKLIVSKIPLLGDSNDVDDFAISLELAKMFNELLAEVVPDLVGVTYSPMDIETVSFDKSNNADNTNTLADSISNLFANAGASQLVIANGKNTSSIAIKYSMLNDISNCWVWVHRLEGWFNFFIKSNISEDIRFAIHKETWYSKEDYLATVKEAATLGAPALDYLTALGDTPYIALQKIKFENAFGLKDMLKPLLSSYTQSSKEAGRPETPDDELTDQGQRSRDANA